MTKVWRVNSMRSFIYRNNILINLFDLITVEATSINQIQAIPFQPEGVFNPNTGLTTNIGTANQGTALPQDCQYSRTSVLVYNVSSDYEEIEFRCETRYDDFTVCGHSSVIAANYTIKRCRFHIIFLISYVN